MSLTVGLAIFAGAVATGTASYIRATGSEAGTIRERIGMESAAATVLGRAAEGLTVQAETEVAINGVTYRVSLTPTSQKVDLATDNETALTQAAEAVGIVVDSELARSATGLANLSNLLRLNASDEDCLRARFTYGRGGQSRSEGDRPPALTVAPGDQLDVRVASNVVPGTVLWMRARFLDQAWALHDYRRLQGVTVCETQGSPGPH
ncbi:hypothetical protein [Brevundimonas sp. M20]|uniref:hypothetical protein n=1 Tax=Brevundimonas sp. M20 TaxID=2591463 RepID=UPI001146FA86|nr:hypothetical protein [Brevundimonas sp. M20]QDH72319.1 hypothetical protein FKQ52_02085 [Brevundimonas sp. M20]